MSLYYAVFNEFFHASADSISVNAMAFTAFGGLSGLAQTGSMIKGTSLSIKTYGMFKLIMTVITAVLAWAAVSLVYPAAVLPADLP